MGGLLSKERDFGNNISKIDKIYKSERETAADLDEISAFFCGVNSE